MSAKVKRLRAVLEATVSGGYLGQQDREDLAEVLDDRDRLLAVEIAGRAVVKLYCANLGTTSEFVSCITPPGPLKELENLKRALGMPAWRTVAKAGGKS